MYKILLQRGKEYIAVLFGSALVTLISLFRIIEPVPTYCKSGNKLVKEVIFSPRHPDAVKNTIEEILPMKSRASMGLQV